MFNLEENKNFKGSLSEFIKIIKEAMYHQYGINDDKITERLIRYYITKSIIPRPLREGKDVFYTYEHILKFLYARKQIIDGWPMGKFREIMKFEENEYFENFLKNYSKSDNNFDAMSLIQEFKSETNYSPERKFRTRSNPLSYSKRVNIPKLKEALVAIDADLGNVVKQEFTTLQMASWLVLLIEKHKLSGMTYDLSRKIGDAVSSALIERNPMTSQELQNEFSQYKDYENLKNKIENLTQENQYLHHRMNEEKIENFKLSETKLDAILHLKSNLDEHKKNVHRNYEKNSISHSRISRRIDTYRDTIEEIDNEKIKREMTDFLEVLDGTLNDYEENFNKITKENEMVMNKLQTELEKLASTLDK